MAMLVSIKQAEQMTVSILEAGLVPHIKGSPGVGKSDLVRQIAKKYNLYVIDFRLAQCDPTDLVGFPTLNADRTRAHYAPPITIPIAGDEIPEGYKGWLLFFDEMTSAPRSVQAASYKVILDRMVGTYKIHPKVAMIAAGNLETDKAIVTATSTALQSRLIHINVDVDTNIWLQWAAKAEIDYRILGFIRFRPNLLMKFNPSHSEDTFPCPRTWDFLSRIIKNKVTIPLEELPLLAGTIGQGTGSEFHGFCQIFESLPTQHTILNYPDQVQIPNDPSIKYALSALLGNLVTEENIEKLMRVIMKLPSEFQILTLRDVLANNITMQANPVVKDWVRVNSRELLAYSE